MISVNISTHLGESDPLLVARNAIFLALFERVAAESGQQVVVDRDKDYVDSHVEPAAETAQGFLESLRNLDLLRYITVDVSTEEEYAILRAFKDEAAIEMV